MEQYGGMGRSPADINPHLGLASRISARPAGIAADGHHHAPGWFPGRSWWSWLCAPVPAPRLTGRFSGGWSWPLWHWLCHQDCAGNGSLFDRSPLSVPSREVYERSTAGASQVSRSSAETGAAPASWKQVYPWPVFAFCSPSADRAGAPCCPAWSVQSDTPISAVFS